ncbi:hypothetical protein ACVMB3_002280 [Sinorhizobium meliloti]
MFHYSQASRARRGARRYPSKWYMINHGRGCIGGPFAPLREKRATLSLMRSRARAVNLFRDMRGPAGTPAALWHHDMRGTAETVQLFRFKSSRTSPSVISPVGSWPTDF